MISARSRCCPSSCHTPRSNWGGSAATRPQDEAPAEVGTDEAQALRALLGRGGVGDIRLRGADVRAAGAGDHARGEEHEKAAREAEEEVADAAGGEADEEDGTAADAVGHPPPDRREEELHDGVDADDGADGGP